MQNLTKSYKNVKVFEGVDFEVKQVSVFALPGSNGAGITTILKILTTLLKQDNETAILKGFDVTGIEVSKTAINLAKKHCGNDLKIHHGNVKNMPFDRELYDGIYCYSLIHLLNKPERKKLIKDGYNQLNQNGYMVFVSVSK